jgi:hypothetical protein
MASSSRGEVHFQQLSSRRSSSDSNREELHSLLSGSDAGSDSDIDMDEKHDMTAVQLEHSSSIQPDGTLKADLVEDRAKEHIAVEHSLSLWQAIQSCPMAIFWCLMVSMCVVSRETRHYPASQTLTENP